MNVEDDPCNHERKWEKELGKDAKKKNKLGKKKETTLAIIILQYTVPCLLKGATMVELSSLEVVDLKL